MRPSPLTVALRRANLSTPRLRFDDLASAHAERRRLEVQYAEALPHLPAYLAPIVHNYTRALIAELAMTRQLVNTNQKETP